MTLCQFESEPVAPWELLAGQNMGMVHSDPGPVLELIEAFRRSKAMFTAVSLGVFDELSAGPQTPADLADKLRLDGDALERLMGGLAGLGFVRFEGGQYANTEVAEVYLCRESPQSLAGYILYSDRMLYPMWGHLEDAVREGSHRWKQTFGIDGPIFSGFFQTPESRETFTRGMHGFGLISSPQVVRVFNLGRFRHIVDLGGATGHLAIAACERYGQMRGTVMDLESVIEQARPRLAASRASARLEAVAGDFFADALPAGDLYAAGRILHDWNEERIESLLAKVYAALPAGGGLLIAETLLDDDGLGPVSSLMQSLNMLVCTEGKERSAVQYETLLKAAGFDSVEARRTGAPLDAILALKKE